MSAAEFGEWKAMFAADQLHPVAEQMRHAQLMAAAHNGPLQRSGKELWAASQFMAPDAWAFETKAAPPNLQAQVDAINAGLK